MNNGRREREKTKQSSDAQIWIHFSDFSLSLKLLFKLNPNVSSVELLKTDTPMKSDKQPQLDTDVWAVVASRVISQEVYVWISAGKNVCTCPQNVVEDFI